MANIKRLKMKDLFSYFVATMDEQGQPKKIIKTFPTLAEAWNYMDKKKKTDVQSFFKGRNSYLKIERGRS